jgi:hypothetical protein
VGADWLDPRDDRILPATRLLAVFIIPFLVVAFVVLYVLPDQTARLFAWEVRPRIQAMYAGAGYVSGAAYFAYAAVGRRWHRVGVGFLSVATFATSMLLLTIIHWEYFDLGHFPFQVWLAIYVVAPPLVLWAWWRNRATDPGTPEEDDLVVPAAVRAALRVLGAAVLAVALVGFVWPQLFVAVWPWELTPLAGRQIAGWQSLIGVGGLAIARDERWSTWRMGLGITAFWHALALVAAVISSGDFATLANWYLAAVVAILVGTAVLFVAMEVRRRRRSALTARAAP